MEVREEELKEISFEEADKLDALNSKYFKAEDNIEYVVSFSSWKLGKKMIPNYNDKTKLEEKVVLELTLESLNGANKRGNGEPLSMQWSMISAKQREAFRVYCENGSITKKTFKYKQKGPSTNRTYQIAEVGDKGKESTVTKKREGAGSTTLPAP